MALGFILLAISFLQSFQSLPWRAAHSEAFAFMAVVAWGWATLRYGTAKVRLNAPISFVFGLMLLVGLQCLGGQIAFVGDALTMLMYAYLGVSILAVTQMRCDRMEWSRLLAATLLFAAVMSAMIALTQALGVWVDSIWIFPSPTYRRPGANIAQANHLGTLMVMGFASLIYLWQRLRFSPVVLILLSFILAGGMAITESRTGLLSGLVLCIWLYGCNAALPSNNRRPLALGVALVLVTFMWAWPSIISQIQEVGLSPHRAEIDTSASLRVVVWPQLWEAVWIRPWLGWGLHGVSVAHNAVLDAYRIGEPYTYAHNIFMELAIGIGLPLTGIVLCLVSHWGWRRIRNAKTIESWYAVAILIPFVIHSFFEYPFAYSYFLIPAMLAIALLEQNYSSSAGWLIPRKAMLGSFALFSVLLVWLGAEYLKVEEDFRVARFESVNLGQVPAEYEHPNLILLTQLKAMLTAMRAVPTSNMPKEEIAILGAVALRFPWVSFIDRYALALALNGNSDEAIRQLQVMRALYGQKNYQKVKESWKQHAKDKYPQLSGLEIP